MSSPAAQTLDSHELLTLVEGVLRRIVGPAGGKVTVAQDPVDAGQQLGTSPQGFRLVLAMGDEESLTGEVGSDGAVRSTISLYVQRGKGLLAKPGGDIASATPGETLPPLLQLCEDLIQIMRAIQIPCDSQGLRFVRSSWVTTDGQDEADQHIHRTRQIDFTVRRSLRRPFAQRLS